MAVLTAVAGCATTSAGERPENARTVAAAPATELCEGDDVVYSGKDGRTALEILLDLDPGARVNGSGDTAFVTEICGRRASEESREYWALHVNGEYADTGAGSLTTTDEDEVRWTLDTY